MSELTAAGLDVYVFGGWAKELRKAFKPKPHGDIDLLMLGFDFDRLDKFLSGKGYPIRSRDIQEVKFWRDDVSLEVFLCEPQKGGKVATTFPNGEILVWPRDTFQGELIEGMPVSSLAAVDFYTAEHARLRPDLHGLAA